MFRKDLLKDWSLVHLPSCDWCLDCPYNTTLKSERQLKEKFDEGNLEKTISIDSNFRGGKQSQSAKKVKKNKKQSIGPSSEKPHVDDFVEVKVIRKQKPTQAQTKKKPQ